MDQLENAKTAVRTAETELRAILVQAAEGGNYDHLLRIAEWAKLLSAILNGQPLTEPASAAILEPPSGELPENGIHQGPGVAKTKILATASRKPKGGRRKKSRRARTAKSDYPKFVREGDSLVKIGWSRREKKPYEHKAPRSVLRSLVQALIRTGWRGERFTVDGLLPLKDIAAGSDIPDYQTYLTLAWLRNLGLITQHGRQGYSLPNGAELERQSEQAWAGLTAR